MNLSNIFKSRTVWVIVVTFIMAGFEGVRDFIPQAYQVYVFGGLGLLATYFRIDAKVDFKGE